jgi:hypothetical protein
MIIRVPEDTKKYMTELLESKIQSNKDEYLFDNIREYRQKYMVEDDNYVKKMTSFENLQTSGSNSLNPTPNFGIGGGTGYAKIKPNEYQKPSLGTSKKIMFGDSEDALSKGAAMYGGGALAGWISSMGGPSLGPKGLKNIMRSPIGGFLQKLGGQIEDLTGKSWFDAQVGNIGQSQMRLAAQGAGSPWTPFVLPGKKRIQKANPQDIENEELGRKIRTAELQQRAKKLNIT